MHVKSIKYKRMKINVKSSFGFLNKPQTILYLANLAM